MGVKRGWLDINRKAPLKAWQKPGDPRGQITLNNMLQMASGLYTESGRNPQGEIYGGSVAAPAFGEIAEFALPYLGVPAE